MNTSQNKSFINHLTIAYWNANGLTNKKAEIQQYLEEKKIDVMLINETHLKPHQRLNIANYHTHRNDRDIKKGGGTAILTKKGIKHYKLPIPEMTNLEATGIITYTKRGPLLIYAVYHPPGKTISEQDIKKLFKDDTPTIAAGDLNAKNKGWNSRVENTNGRKLDAIALSNDLQILGPPAPTHFHVQTGTMDTLDITVTKNCLYHINLTTDEELTSDHLPVRAEVNLEIEASDEKVKTTKWGLFRDSIKIAETTIGTKEELEEAVTNLEETIKTHIEKCSHTRTRKETQYRLPEETRKLLQEKRRATKEYRRTLDHTTKRKLNEITEKVRKAIREYQDEEWTKKTESMTDDRDETWRIAKNLRKEPRSEAPLEKDGNIAITDQCKADLFAQALENQFSPNQIGFDIREDTQRKEVDRIINKRSDYEIRPTDEKEIQEIIKNIQTKKAPGIDEIPNKALKNLPRSGIRQIRNITNGIFKLQEYPTRWKTAVTIMIPKPNKPRKDPGSYRPISLLPAISKVIERVINARLREHTEEKKIIPEEQYGFRRGHSTTHQLTRITEIIKEGIRTKSKTGGIFLDVEKAFDKIWHEGLIFKMDHIGFPTPLIKLTQTYLKDRRFKVKINQHYSEPRKITAGVPQGAVIGPTLFNIYTSDIPRHPRTEIGLYADDTTILAKGKKTDIIRRNLQEHIKAIETWTKMWKIKINAEKSVAVLFSKNIRKPEEKQPISIDNKEIQWKKEAKYLGVIIDEKLKFHRHIEETMKKCNRLRGYLSPLLSKRSHLSPTVKVMIYKQVLRPALTYGGTIWKTSARTNMEKIRRFQDTTLRRCLGAPYYVKNKRIQEDTRTKNIEKYLEDQEKKLEEQMETHENATIRDALERKKKNNPAK